MRSWKKPCTCLMLASMTCQLIPQRQAAADHFFGRVARLVEEKEYSGTEPATCADGSIEILAENIDWLEHHIDTYGSIVAKQPDIWGEARLTKHRDEYEKILFQELNQFEFKLNAAIRQSDQSFATAAIALSDAAATTTSKTSRTPAQRFRRDAVTTVTESQTVTPIVINPTDLKGTLPTSPTVAFKEPYELDRFAGNDKINIEPTVYLDQLSRYVQHLNELRRINEGDDTSDSPGYAMNLVRIPVSLLPGKLTREGFGGEITITATPVITDDLLPTTYRNLVINDLVSQFGLTIVKFVEIRAWDRLEESKAAQSKLEQLKQEQDALQARADDLKQQLDERERDLADANNQIRQASGRRETALEKSRTIEKNLSGKIDHKAIATDLLANAIGNYIRLNPHDYKQSAPQLFGVPDDGTAAQIELSPENMAAELRNENLGAEAKNELRTILKDLQNTQIQEATAEERRIDELQESIQPLRAEIISLGEQLTQITGVPSTTSENQMEIARGKGALDAINADIARLRNEIGVITRSLEIAGTTTLLNSARNRGSQQPLAPTQLVDVYGRECLAAIARDFYISYRGRDVRWAGYQECEIKGKPVECRVNLIDVRLWLQSELEAAFDLLSQPEPLNLWVEYAHPSRGLASEIRQNFIPDPNSNGPLAFRTVPAAREQFLTRLYEQNPAITGSSSCCKRTLECLTWAITVESALLNQRLNEDLRKVSVAKQCSCVPNQSLDYLFFLPDPAARPESPFNADFTLATQAFKEYVKCRWPIHVFAIDPASQDQNVADLSSRRRELQLALSMGFTQGAVSAQTLMQYSRQLETEVETLSLNQTIVGFGHGSDTFGWRFYPRVQALDQPGAAGTVWQSFRGTPRDHDVRKRQLEPGMRECVAVVLMPSFVPYADFDVRSNWFRLTNPKNAALTMKDTMKLSRAVTAMRQSRAQCAQCAHCYREGEVDRLLKRVDQLDHELPLQTMRQQIPFENTLGGFQMFSTGVTDFAPELYGWYGAPGVVVGDNYQCGCYADCQYCKATDKSCKRESVDGASIMQSSNISQKALPIPVCEGSGTTLFLVGDHLSVHDTKIIAGGVCIPDVRLVSREIMRVTIPSCVNTVEVAGQKYVALYAATPYGVTNHLHIPIVEAPKSAEKKAQEEQIKGLTESLNVLAEAAPTLQTEGTLSFDADCAALGSSRITLISKNPPMMDVELGRAAQPPGIQGYQAAISYKGILSGAFDVQISRCSIEDATLHRLHLDKFTIDRIIEELATAQPAITTTSFDDKGKAEARLYLYAVTTDGRTVPLAGQIPIEITLACKCCETAKPAVAPAAPACPSAKPLGTAPSVPTPAPESVTPPESSQGAGEALPSPTVLVVPTAPAIAPTEKSADCNCQLENPKEQ